MNDRTFGIERRIRGQKIDKHNTKDGGVELSQIGMRDEG